MLKHEDLSEEIIIAFYKVYNKLGYGFLESVYQNALYLELKNQKLHVETQKKIEVYYDGQKVGTYFADMVVEGVVILELKAESFLHIKHEKTTTKLPQSFQYRDRFTLKFWRKARTQKAHIFQ